MQQRGLCFDSNMHALARADACAAPPPRFAGLAPAPLAVSLASSDSACSINRTLWHALDFLAPSTRLVVHIGCGSPATTEERKALGAISPRVLVNPHAASRSTRRTARPRPHPGPDQEVASRAPPCDDDHHHHPYTHPLPPPRHQARSSTPTCSTCGCSPPRRPMLCCSHRRTCAGSPQASRPWSAAAPPPSTAPPTSHGSRPSRRSRPIGAPLPLHPALPLPPPHTHLIHIHIHTHICICIYIYP